MKTAPNECPRCGDGIYKKSNDGKVVWYHCENEWHSEYVNGSEDDDGMQGSQLCSARADVYRLKKILNRIGTDLRHGKSNVEILKKYFGLV